MRRIDYAGSVHDEEEIAAVVEVLRGPSTALRIGRNVRAFEEGVAELPNVPFRDHVWPKFLSENATSVLKLEE